MYKIFVQTIVQIELISLEVRLENAQYMKSTEKLNTFMWNAEVFIAIGCFKMLLYEKEKGFE